MIKTIVLTGGPCSGKSTVLRALKSEFDEQVVLVPEVASILLHGGYPMPGRDICWSQEWQAGFQAMVLATQLGFEKSYRAVARTRGVKLIVCDRGVLDGAAYTPGGIEEFFRKHRLCRNECFDRYWKVIHLVSLAVSKPELYGKNNNEARFETLKEAQRIETDTREAWNMHPGWQLIDGNGGLEGKIVEVASIIKANL